MSDYTKTIGILTSGGDSPGMNAVVRAVTRAAILEGMKVKGIIRGYHGLIEGDIIDMDAHSVSETIQRGGTILCTARSKEFMTLEGQIKAATNLRTCGIDTVVAIGGDGTFRGIGKLSEQGIDVMGIPATIDLDIACTEYTIGFDTAVNTAIDAIDKIRDTSSSHERCSIVEVMGRHAGYIALCSGISTGAEDILMPEEGEIDVNKIIEHVKANRAKGKSHHIIINAEGIGHSASLAKKIEEATGIDTRATILGYLQRGGSPAYRDRFFGSLMGTKAVDLIASGKTGRILAVKNGRIVDYGIEEALAMEKKLLPDWLRTKEILVR